MTLVDTSVWVPYFNGESTPQTDRLDHLLQYELVAIGDLILTEVLQGFRSEKGYQQARQALEVLPFYHLGGRAIALQAADHFRTLRKRGITIRKTIDVIIATACEHHGLTLLHHDRDFDAMTEVIRS